MHRLDVNELERLGKKASMIRERLRDQAQEAVYDTIERGDVLESTMNSIEKFNSRQHTGYFKRYRVKAVNIRDFIDIVPYPERRKGKLRPKLSLNEKLEISSLVLIDHHMYKDVAKKYRVSVNCIS